MSENAVERAVLETVKMVASQRNPEIGDVNLEQALGNDLGFDSLDLAQVAAELEVKLGKDPFARSSAVRVLTVRDLVTLYGTPT